LIVYPLVKPIPHPVELNTEIEIHYEPPKDTDFKIEVTPENKIHPNVVIDSNEEATLPLIVNVNKCLNNNCSFNGLCDPSSGKIFLIFNMKKKMNFYEGICLCQKGFTGKTCNIELP